MKKLIAFIALTAVMTSCSKDGANPQTTEEQFSADIEFSVKGNPQGNLPLYNPSNEYDFLGYGYDVTDRFNDQASVRASVVNIPLYAASGDSRVNISKATEGGFTSFIYKDAVVLSEKLSNSFDAVKGNKFFGNTITQAFPETIADDKKYVYGYFSDYHIWKRRTFYYEQTVNNFLTDDFKRDISLLDAKGLVNKYGTHVLTGISLGSKFDVVYQADVKENLDREAVGKEGMGYALWKTFGFGYTYLGQPNLKNLNANSSAKIYYSFVGGDFKTLVLENMGNRQVLDPSNWKKTTTEDRARFVGPLTKGLEPLYKFIDNAEKKDMVKTYLEEYYSAKAVKLKN